MDYPNGRKIHSIPIPRLGGVALAAAVALTILLGSLRNPYIRAGLPMTTGMIAGLAIILIVGIYDDVRNASALLKLAAQFAAAGVVVAFGIRFQLASNPLASKMLDYFDLGVLSIPLTICWIVGLTNAMNLIDG